MAFITIEGEQLIAHAVGASDPLLVDRFILANITGLGAEPADRVATVPNIGAIVYDQPPSAAGYVSDDQVVYSAHLDTTLGDFDFNWLGIASGPTLIAATYLPATITKRATVGGTTGNNLTRNMLLAFSGAQSLSGITVEASTWQIDYTARLWDMDGRQRDDLAAFYGRAAFFQTGWALTKTGSAYSLQPGTGIVGGVRIESGATLPVTVAGYPASVWLDVSLQGDLNGVAARVTPIVSSGAQSDYVDSTQRQHTLVRVADIGGSGSVIDRRTVHDVSTDVLSYLTRPATTAHAGMAPKATSQAVAAGNDNAAFVTPALLAAALRTAMPAGCVLMWSGALSAVPQGWALCDGQDGRPDLRNRFVVGAGGSYDQAASGGSAESTSADSGEHSHAVQVAGAHSHPVTVDPHTLTEGEIPRHGHPWRIKNQNVGSSNGNPAGGMVLSVGGTTINSYAGAPDEDHQIGGTGGGGSHRHTGRAAAAGDHSHALADAGVHTHTVDVRPPYMALAYIVKL